MGPRRFLRYAAVIAVGIAASSLVAVPASQAASPDQIQAARPGPGVPPGPQVIVTKGVKSANPAAACEVNFYGYIGHKICGTEDFTVFFNDGHVRRFVIGTDNAVWNIVRYPNGAVSGWRSLGGWLRTYVRLNFVDFNDAYFMGIYAIGGDNRHWCKDLVGSWGPWFPC